MKAPHVGEAAIDLPWLSPCAATLVALARAPTASLWDDVRGDPAGVLLLLRHTPADISGTVLAACLRSADALQTALPLLAGPGFIDWHDPGLFPIYAIAKRQATLAQLLAGHVAGCDPDRAWIGGLLAPLGWLAVCAVSAPQVEACRAHPSFARNSAEAQRHCWGLDHTAVARRLARCWNLPAWLGAIVGHLGLPVAIAQTLGGEPTLFQVAQLAAALSNQRGHGLGLAVGATVDELRDVLGLSADVVDETWRQAEALELTPPTPWQAPARCPLLSDLLQMALENRRGADHVLAQRLQHDVDQLQRALEEQCAGERARLQVKKLAALAELAAGAGHEINNPLAVISGQAQYLAGHETDPERNKSLQTIVNQAQRIHQILIGLMQFARPPAPQKQYVDANGLVRAVVESLQEPAHEREVKLVCPEPPAGLEIHADGGQIRLALAGLLRNAVEAASAEGWAGIRILVTDDESLEFIVEDNGPGPTATIQEHMFDPFYSGRTAGRGRGLGLATAWRLARQNGGDVVYAGHDAGITRFLRLPQVRYQPAETTTNGQPQAHNGSTIIVSTSC